MSPNVTVKLTGAVVIGGHLVKPPALVELTDAEARELLRRGKAVVATATDAPADAVSDSAVVAKSTDTAPPSDADVAPTTPADAQAKKNKAK